MKRVVLPMLFAVVTLPVLAEAQTAGAKPTAPAAAPAAAGVRTIELVVNNDNKFSNAAITAKPGEKLKVVIKNMGTMPKMAGGHNFVLLKKDAKVMEFANAAMMASATNYIPESMKDQVISSTTLSGPGETVEVTFTVPTAPGAYPYICSFAGHFALGMKGTLTVK